MDQLMVGWVKWVDNKPDQQEMGLLTEGHTPPARCAMGDTDEAAWEVAGRGKPPSARSAMGDTDQAAWEVDASGKPRDPWQFTNYLILKKPGKQFKAEE